MRVPLVRRSCVIEHESVPEIVLPRDPFHKFHLRLQNASSHLVFQPTSSTVSLVMSNLKSKIAFRIYDSCLTSVEPPIQFGEDDSMRLTQTRSVRLVHLMCACMKHTFSKFFELYKSRYIAVFIEAIIFLAILKYFTLIIQR
jgi:hypothetical protein